MSGGEYKDRDKEINERVAELTKSFREWLASQGLNENDIDEYTARRDAIFVRAKKIFPDIYKPNTLDGNCMRRMHYAYTEIAKLDEEYGIEQPKYEPGTYVPSL